MRTASVCGVLLLGSCAHAPDPKILEAAQSYVSYGRVDDLQRSAPTGCRAVQIPPPHMSISRDADTHGKKLYYLFAKNQEAYRTCHELPQPVGQALVKESWIPAATSSFAKPVKEARGPLFLMIKTGEPDSDEGWIYATATPDGKTITASGKLASCMECHQTAKYDRLFGLTSCAGAK